MIAWPKPKREMVAADGQRLFNCVTSNSYNAHETHGMTENFSAKNGECGDDSLSPFQPPARTIPCEHMERVVAQLRDATYAK